MTKFERNVLGMVLLLSACNWADTVSIHGDWRDAMNVTGFVIYAVSGLALMFTGNQK